MKPRKKVKEKIIYVMLAGTVVILAVIFALLFRKGERIVSVLDYMGTVGMERSSMQEKEMEIFQGLRVLPGDFLWTKEKSNITVMVDEDKVIRLEENSQAEFSELLAAGGKQVTLIDLKKGTIVNDLREKLKDNVTYEITTPNATISVRGTYFVVYVGQEPGYDGIVTKVNVYDGVVAVENKSGEISILHSGDESVEEWNEWENGLDLVSGNRAIVGDRTICTMGGVDFEMFRITAVLRVIRCPKAALSETLGHPKIPETKADMI